MNLEDVKLKQEKEVDKIVYKRISFSDKIKDELINRVLSGVSIVKDGEVKTIDYGFDINEVVVDGVYQLYLYDVEITQDRLFNTAKEVSSDISKIMKVQEGLDPKIITNIINEEIKGENWSNRIWTNKIKLASELKSKIQLHVEHHELNREVFIKDISRRFEVDNSVAKRLLFNETNRVENRVRDVKYKEAGYSFVRFESMKDELVSETCQALDGNIYSLDDNNRPKIPEDTHVGCRSYYVPHTKGQEKYKFY